VPVNERSTDRHRAGVGGKDGRGGYATASAADEQGGGDRPKRSVSKIHALCPKVAGPSVRIAGVADSCR
jgi:hypothetical protein